MLILGSTSPRRIELLKTLTTDFITLNPSFNESLISKKEKHYALKEALNKALSLKNQIKEDDLLITSDTVVILKKEIIGKPTSLENAKEILSKLSNNHHKVVTGVVILYKNKIYLKEVTSYVYFNKLDPSTIDNYIKKENVLDKAGAYAIQDDKNFHIIKKIKGDYYNVMGFPLFYIKKQLKKFNFI